MIRRADGAADERAARMRAEAVAAEAVAEVEAQRPHAQLGRAVAESGEAVPPSVFGTVLSASCRGDGAESFLSVPAMPGTCTGVAGRFGPDRVGDWGRLASGGGGARWRCSCADAVLEGAGALTQSWLLRQRCHDRAGTSPDCGVVPRPATRGAVRASCKLRPLISGYTERSDV